MMESSNSPERALPGWKFTSRFLKKQGQGPFVERLARVRAYFPELESCTITVGVTERADGKADRETLSVWFRSRGVGSLTIAHELMHLLQGRNGIPKGERSCDIYAMARHESLCDEAPHYLKIPPSFLDDRKHFHPWARPPVHALAREAIVRRGKGLRRYISWFENELKRIDLEKTGKKR